MLGQKTRMCKVHSALSLEDLVPRDTFYRQLDAKLDLSVVRELVSQAYSTQLGRPSIDPVGFFKLQLIMFFEGIRSERQLMAQVRVNLAHRWYIGYDLDEAGATHQDTVWHCDEMRFGLWGQVRRRRAVRGVNIIQPRQIEFAWEYLVLAVDVRGCDLKWAWHPG